MKIREEIVQHVLQLVCVELKSVAQQDELLQLVFVIGYGVVADGSVAGDPPDAVQFPILRGRFSQFIHESRLRV